MSIAHDQAEPERTKHLAAAIQQAIETRRELKTHCPAHDDKRPSLGVRGTARGLKVKCYAGCDEAEIEAEINALGLWPKAPRKRVVKEYDYRDASGNLLFQKLRYEPKDFRLRRPDGKGGWIWSIKGLTPIPYQLDLIAKAPTDTPILVVGGEKDCDNAAKLGQLATTSHSGEGKNWPREINQHFANWDIIILPDNDDAGELYAKSVAVNLAFIARRIRIVRLPGLPPKGDLTDWIEGGGTRDQLLKLIEAAQPLSDADLAVLAADPTLEVDDKDLAGLRKINDRYVFLRSPVAVLDTIAGVLYTATEFRLLEAPSGLAGAWLQWNGRRTATRLVHEPGQPGELPDGSYNLCEPIPEIPMDETSIGRYWKGLHECYFPTLRHVFGRCDSAGAVILQQWAAYPIQNPGMKLSTAMLMKGVQGGGKSILGECIAAAHPRGWAQECEVDQIFSKFNKLFLGKTFTYCNELLIGGANPRKMADHLKNLITRQEIIIEPKRVDAYSVRDFNNYYLTTNHVDSAYLEGDDRRMIVLDTGRKPLDAALGTKVGEWSKTDEGRNAMRFYFLQYPMNATIVEG